MSEAENSAAKAQETKAGAAEAGAAKARETKAGAAEAGAAETGALLELRNVCKAYGGTPVLRGVSLALVPGAPVCVTGRSGIGKTTLLRLLLGLERPDSGTVFVRRGARLAAVFQENRLIAHLSAAENVRFVCPAAAQPSDGALAEAFAAVGLSRQEMEKKASELSGGQQRRTALLRALLAPADAVLLDEPFTGLDAAARRAAAAYLRASCASRALLCITHEPNDAALLGARMHVLEDG